MNQYSGLNRAFTTFVNTLDYNSEEKVGDLLKPDKFLFNAYEKIFYLKKYSGLARPFANLVNTLESNCTEKVGDLLKPDKIIFP